MLCVWIFSKQHIYSISATHNFIKMNFSGNVEGDVELNEKTECASMLSNEYISNVSGTFKDVYLTPTGILRGIVMVPPFVLFIFQINDLFLFP